MGDTEAQEAALAVLRQDVGTWDTELRITPWPGAPVNETTGVATNRLVGGRWLVTDQATESGFEGHGVYGWDPDAGRYVGVWVDGAGGGMARGEGTWDEAARTMTYAMTAVHGGGTVRYREVTRRLDDRTREYRNLMPVPGGGEHEVIRATYRRR